MHESANLIQNMKINRIKMIKMLKAKAFIGLKLFSCVFSSATRNWLAAEVSPIRPASNKVVLIILVIQALEIAL